MTRPRWLSGLDASFLHLESAAQPLQVISVLELDTSTIPGGYDWDHFRHALTLRLRGLPAFRERPARGVAHLGRPVWVDDGDLDGDHDLDRHLHRIGLPASPGRAELARICGELAALPLGRDRLPWEMWVIEGGQDPDRLAVMVKVHHAAADGVTFAAMLSQLCSTDIDCPPAVPAAPMPSARRLVLVIGGLARFLGRLPYAVALLPATARAVVDTVRRAVSGRAMAAPFTAPRTALNARLTPARRVAFARLDLDDVKRVKNHFGVTVNDVLMALIGGVVRQFLLERGELPSRSLVALVPVSVHESVERQERNQVSGMYARLLTQIADPAERLRAMAPANTIAKEHSSSIGAMLLQDWCELTGPVTLGIAKRAYARITRFRPMYNVIVSNVPGPRARYFLGAEITAMYPFGPVLHGAGLNITMWTVNGVLHVGVISCPDLLGDPGALADGLATGLRQLLAEVD
ncbi:wax ester/triacylglycerol synthase family O-acyltransferase [Mycolicibacterium sp.]|uniref:WS/DGAT/MGAT family O-acyltransferase n=1 Tax=Mycolicibacterium sp. TaxID=2320850 RepID=UPI001A1D7700|nr:wax ester/triacylglycerol synthase family O-acyltransferase [Mycolicibacterium sp.]MBJ7339975.1 wax ester/triacylglycerol synthase family O-acyltransferase [Mycolicibacterium sp.]